MLCVRKEFKGIVHPKMKIVSSLTPSSCSKPEWISFFCWTQKKIFWRMYNVLIFYYYYFYI